MGATTSKQIQSTLETQYKPIRKYYDDFYGQITVLQNRQSNEIVAKSQKIIQFANEKKTLQYIQKRINNISPLLINLKAYFTYSIDMCSQNKRVIFILQYFPCTLLQQIQRRQTANSPFSSQQLSNLFYSIIQAYKLQRQIEIKNKILIANSAYIYVGNNKVKVLQSIFCDKKQLTQPNMNFNQISYQSAENKQYYASPQSFIYLCRKQKMKAMQISQQQSSIIFTIGMNFLQCALLADLSQFYNKQQKQFEFQRLQQSYQEVLEIYGEDIYKLIVSMTQLAASKRPTLIDVEGYLKYLAQIQSNRTTQNSYIDYNT